MHVYSYVSGGFQWKRTILSVESYKNELNKYAVTGSYKLLTIKIPVETIESPVAKIALYLRFLLA